MTEHFSYNQIESSEVKNSDNYQEVLETFCNDFSDEEINMFITSIHQITAILVKRYISDSNADLEK